ncbi:MAG: hypothetical protein FWE41_08310 [Coriobacteriia bacterium]|nr:hypothetical protein [Coriobacteriia bacterium]MCL2750508.1 hypothetical protein [Coriobacteriia bacterium]
MAKQIGRATKVKIICENPQSAAILEKYVPGCLTNPLFEQAYPFPLKMILSQKELKLTKEQQKECILEIEAAGLEE